MGCVSGMSSRLMSARRLCPGHRVGTLAIVLACILVTASCATKPDPRMDPEGYAEYVEINDPLEPFNRGVFAFNQGVDTVLLTPIGIFYRDIVPPIMQTGVNNILKNLRAPVTFLNDLLQGNPDRAGSFPGQLDHRHRRPDGSRERPRARVP
jgi:phospholipid-binding lipoprotein MlaA